MRAGVVELSEIGKARAVVMSSASAGFTRYENMALFLALEFRVGVVSEQDGGSGGS